jgi:hypothetical protein
LRLAPGATARTLRRMTKRVRVHDGIIGALLAGTSALGVLVDPRFLWLTGLTGLIMLQSAFTGFCPVHFIVNRAIAEPAKSDR